MTSELGARICSRVNVWQTLVDSDPTKLHQELDRAHTILADNIREVRRSIFALRPVDFDELGFYQTMQQFVTAFGEQQGLVANLSIAGARERLPVGWEPLLMRIAQEALNNISKHARARRVRVTLNLESADRVVMQIEDDGIGFAVGTLEQAARRGHYGIVQMRERVAGVGGTLTIESESGQGTCVRVMLPMPWRVEPYAE